MRPSLSVSAITCLAWLALSGASVSAAEMQPNNVDNPSLIRGGDSGGAWYAVPAGGALTFDVIGPASLTVEIVQRLPDTNTGPKGQVKAKGDGMDILTVKLDGELGQGSIMDGQGGWPSLIGKATINVPAGEHVFSLEPVSDSLPMLARVDAPEGAIPAKALVEATEPAPEPAAPEPAAPEPAAEAEPAAPEPAEPAVVEAESAEAEAEPATPEPAVVEAESAEAEAEPAAPEPAVVEAVAAAEAEPAGAAAQPATPEPAAPEPAVVEAEPVEATTPSTSAPYQPDLGPPAGDTQQLWVGVRSGLGSARAGNRASLYLGLEVLYPTQISGLDLGARLGRYGVGLQQELAIQPPIGGSVGTQDLSWSTRVRPLELGARYSFQTGSLSPYLWGALAAYSSTRVSDGDKVRGGSLGTSWALGLDFDLSVGVLSPEFAFNLGSRDFGNLEPSGDPAKEKLSGSRINVAYRIAF